VGSPRPIWRTARSPSNRTNVSSSTSCS
jgi:hypothetical protein